MRGCAALAPLHSVSSPPHRCSTVWRWCNKMWCGGFCFFLFTGTSHLPKSPSASSSWFSVMVAPRLSVRYWDCRAQSPAGGLLTASHLGLRSCRAPSWERHREVAAVRRCNFPSVTSGLSSRKAFLAGPVFLETSQRRQHHPRAERASSSSSSSCHQDQVPRWHPRHGAVPWLSGTGGFEPRGEEQ